MALRIPIVLCLALCWSLVAACSVRVDHPAGNEPPRFMYVNLDELSVRPCPGYTENCRSFAKLPLGDRVEVLEWNAQHSWARVRSLDPAVEGWVRGRNLSP